MMALSIRQPWASLILAAGKDIENRCWPTRYRGRFLVHAAKGCTRDEWADAIEFAEDILDSNITTDLKAIPRGGIIGSVELVDCVSASESPWFVGEYGFVLRDPKWLPFVPWKGQLGFFDVPESALPSNVEFSGTPAALSPEAPLERHVSRQDNFISAEMLKTALMTPEQQALVEQMICPKCGVMTLLRKHDGGGMLFNQCSQCLTVWVLTANV